MKRKYWYEALAYLGVDSANEEKRERLITAEVEKGNSITNMMRNTRLNARKDAAKQINNMFGLELEPVYRDISSMTQLPGGEEFEPLYN